MGPPSEDGGNAKKAIVLIKMGDSLQWGRRPKTAEIRRDSGRLVCAVELQWGRRPKTAEIRLRRL